MKILIVDDNDRMRHLIRNLIQDLAEEIDERRDGSEVLAAFAGRPPDWVLMDISMKEMDGLTATQQLRAAYPKARVIIVSNYDDAVIRQEARSAGACGYVTKANLWELRQILGGAKLTEPSAGSAR